MFYHLVYFIHINTIFIRTLKILHDIYFWIGYHGNGDVIYYVLGILLFKCNYALKSYLSVTDNSIIHSNTSICVHKNPSNQ